MMSIDPLEEARMNALSRILASELGLHFLEIENAVDRRIHLKIEIGGRHATEDRAKTQEEVFAVRVILEHLHSFNSPLDSSTGTIPQQLAALFRKLAGELSDMAVTVEAIPGVRPCGQAHAHCLADHESGEVFSKKITFRELVPSMIAYEEIRNGTPTYLSGPAQDHPEVFQEWRDLLTAAGIPGIDDPE